MTRVASATAKTGDLTRLIEFFAKEIVELQEEVQALKTEVRALQHQEKLGKRK